MINLDKGIALEGGEVTSLHATEWQQALRLGPVVDIKTGKQVLDVTPALCAEIAKAHAALGERMRTPIDLDHGMVRKGATAEEKRGYGFVDAVEARDDGLFVKLALNKGGQKWVEENKGTSFLSPTIFSDLFDPEVPGRKIADAYMVTVSLTTMPRQTSLPEVALSRADGDAQPIALLARFDSTHEVRVFEDALRTRGRLLFLAEGLIHGREDYVCLLQWEGADEGTAVYSWWAEGKGDQTRRLTWARTADGGVSVSGPSEAVQAVTTYQPISPAAQAATLSRAQSPKEVPMLGNAGGAGTVPPLLQPYTVLLSRVPEADRPEVEKALGDLAGRATKAEQERDEARVALSRAEVAAEGEKRASVALLSRLEKLEKDAADKAKADHEAARDAFLREHVALGRWSTSEEDRAFWGGQFDTSPENARAVASRMPKGAAGPVVLGRAPGLDGEGVESAGDRNKRIEAAAHALADKHPGMPFADRWNMAEKAEKGGR